MMKPKISIICCWLGINDCVVSANSINRLMTEDVDLEVVLIDSSANGKLASLIECDHIRIKHIRYPKTTIYDAFNKGVTVSTSEWFVFLHEGDSFFSNFNFVTLFTAFDLDPDGKSLICCDYAIEHKAGLYFLRKNTVFKPLLGVMPIHVGVVCSRKLWEEIGYFDERITISSDYDFLIRCYLVNAKFHYSREILGFMEGTGASRRRKWVAIYEDINIIRRHFGLWAIYAVFLKKIRFVTWYLISKFRGGIELKYSTALNQ